MRATLVYPGCHPRGGVERVVWELARHLAPRHSVRVICSQADEGGLQGVEIDHVSVPSHPGTLEPFRWRRQAARRIGAAPNDVVVTFGTAGPPGDVMIVQSVHRAWLEHGRSVRYRGVRVPARLRYARASHLGRLALEAAALRPRAWRLVIPVAENVAVDLERIYGVPRDRMVVLPNGFSADQCSPARSAALREEMRAELELTEGDVGLLLIANEWHRKGLEVLLDAVAILADPRLIVLLVGRVAPSGFLAQTRRLGLEGRVRYFGPAQDVARFYAAADLFVMPSQYEAFGSVIVEALASGLPVITTRLAGAAVAVQEGVNGLLQNNPDDAKELASLLKQALDPAARAQWALAAGASVGEYEWSRIMQRMEGLITTL